MTKKEKEMKLVQMQTHHVIEVPPEGSVYFIEVMVPAKEAQVKRLLYWGEHHTYTETILVPDKDHPEFERMVKEQVEKAIKENEEKWKKYYEEEHEEDEENAGRDLYEAIFGAIFGKDK